MQLLSVVFEIGKIDWNLGDNNDLTVTSTFWMRQRTPPVVINSYSIVLWNWKSKLCHKQIQFGVTFDSGWHFFLLLTDDVSDSTILTTLMYCHGLYSFILGDYSTKHWL